MTGKFAQSRGAQLGNDNRSGDSAPDENIDGKEEGESDSEQSQSSPENKKQRTNATSDSEAEEDGTACSAKTGEWSQESESEDEVAPSNNRKSSRFKIEKQNKQVGHSESESEDEFSIVQKAKAIRFAPFSLAETAQIVDEMSEEFDTHPISVKYLRVADMIIAQLERAFDLNNPNLSRVAEITKNVMLLLRSVSVHGP